MPGRCAPGLYSRRCSERGGLRLVRWFIPDDVDMLEEDLSQLQALFEADGEGLPRGDIQVTNGCA